MKSNEKTINKVLIIILFVFLVYSNLHTLFWRIELARNAESDQPLITSYLPSSPVITDLLDTFSVFSYYEDINRDFVIKGYPENNKNNSAADWIDLKVVDKYFPQFLGEQQMRLYLTKHYGLGGDIHQMACKNLAVKIRELYNRENPKNLMKKVMISIEYWPRGFNSYREFKTKKNINYQTLCVED